MTIETELLAIKGDDELLRPEDIVKWAREHPNSDLHGQFEWDNRKAAEEYRIWQARRIVSIHLIYEEGDRKFISLRIDRTHDGGGYRDLEDMKDIPDLMRHALSDALAELGRTRQRYNFLKQLAPVWKEVEKVKGRPKQKAKQAERRSASQSHAPPS